MVRKAAKRAARPPTRKRLRPAKPRKKRPAKKRPAKKKKKYRELPFQKLFVERIREGVEDGELPARTTVDGHIAGYAGGIVLLMEKLLGAAIGGADTAVHTPAFNGRFRELHVELKDKAIPKRERPGGAFAAPHCHVGRPAPDQRTRARLLRRKARILTICLARGDDIHHATEVGFHLVRCYLCGPSLKPLDPYVIGCSE